MKYNSEANSQETWLGGEMAQKEKQNKDESWLEGRHPLQEKVRKGKKSFMGEEGKKSALITVKDIVLPKRYLREIVGTWVDQ